MGLHSVCESLIGSYGTPASLCELALQVVGFGVSAAGRETCTDLIVSIVDCGLLREATTTGVKVCLAWGSLNMDRTQARLLYRYRPLEKKADDDQQSCVSHF